MVAKKQHYAHSIKDGNQSWFTTRKIFACSFTFAFKLILNSICGISWHIYICIYIQYLNNHTNMWRIFIPGTCLSSIFGLKNPPKQGLNSKYKTRGPIWVPGTYIFCYKKYCTLPETNKLPLKMDAWNTMVSFCDGLASGAKMVVSGSLQITV